MITIIITGHGNFATGMLSAVSLISGEHEALYAVDFDGQIGQEELSNIYLNTINKTSNKNILFCTDLVGGTPFKTACQFKYDHPEFNVEVLSGTNLGILLEGVMSASFAENLLDFANQLVNTGKDQVCRFELIKKQEVEATDGI